VGKVFTFRSRGFESSELGGRNAKALEQEGEAIRESSREVME